MSGEAFGWAFKQPHKDPLVRYVHVAIGDVVNDLYHNEFWMSQQSLANKTGLCVRTIRDALKTLEEGGYLEVVSSEPGQTVRYRFLFPTPAPHAGGVGTTCRGTPAPHADKPQVELKKLKVSCPDLSLFPEFWEPYPRKDKKKDAERAWVQTTKVRPSLQVLMAAVERAKLTRQWRQGFIPMPATWLRQEMWNDQGIEPGTNGFAALSMTEHEKATLEKMRNLDAECERRRLEEMA